MFADWSGWGLLGTLAIVAALVLILVFSDEFVLFFHEIGFVPFLKHESSFFWFYHWHSSRFLHCSMSIISLNVKLSRVISRLSRRWSSFAVDAVSIIFDNLYLIPQGCLNLWQNLVALRTQVPIKGYSSDTFIHSLSILSFWLCYNGLFDRALAWISKSHFITSH